LCFDIGSSKMATNNMLNDNKNPIIPKDKAQSILEPHFHTLLDIINGAWKAWEDLGTIAPDLREPLSNHCRARYVNRPYRARFGCDGMQ
jgi:hypothetical protein